MAVKDDHNDDDDDVQHSAYDVQVPRNTIIKAINDKCQNTNRSNRV